MKTLRQHLTPSLLILLAASSFAQHARAPQLLQAQALSEQGQSRAAIAILEPLVQSDARILDAANLGVAWNLLGSAYTDFENYDKARRCFETAIHILKAIPDEQVQYATALDNLGAVELSNEHLDESILLRSKARRVYETIGNHAGIAISSSNLAAVNLKQNDLRAARQNLAKAFREAQRTNQLSENNLATIYIVKGWLARSEHDLHAAVAAFQQAIDLWTHSYGPQFFMLGIAYALRGQVFDSLGDHQHSIADLQHALALLDKTPGHDAPAWLMTKLVYAQVLRNAGSKQEAAQMEKETKTAMAGTRIRQCGGCTISAESFR